MIIRGTTPTLEFELPFGTDQLAEAYVTLAQREVVLVDKPLTECQCDGNKLTVKLTQEETLKLDRECNTEIQIRARLLSGDAIASAIIRESTERILKDGVI